MVAILTVLLFIILGNFYKANDHSIGVNVLVWLAVVVVAHTLTYVGNYALKKGRSCRPYFDLLSITIALITVTLICLFKSQELEDYLFVSVMGGASGIAGTFQLLSAAKRPPQKNKDN